MRKAYSAPMIRLIADPEEVKNLQERFSSVTLLGGAITSGMGLRSMLHEDQWRAIS